MAFDTAVSGIKAASTSLGIIGNNIANSATVGFKTSKGQFADVFATSLLGASKSAYGSGVSVSAVTQSFSQGNIAATDNVLDMAIDGRGFFVVSNEGSNVYTRAGNFSVDKDNFVVNAQGHRLQIFKTTDAGVQEENTFSDLSVSNEKSLPSATVTGGIEANLDSRSIPGTGTWPTGGFNAFATPPTAPTADLFAASTSLTVYDALGNSHVQSMYFEKTSTPNQWNVHTLIDGVTQGTAVAMNFDSNGQIPTASQPLNLSITNWTPLKSDGTPVSTGTTQSYTVDLSKVTQFGSDFGVTGIKQDGYAPGEIRGVEVGESGNVFARYTNGQAKSLGIIGLVNFNNISGLQNIGNSSWAETFSSGTPIETLPGASGLGLVRSGSLEDSNVEVTEQLVNMIVAQRNFQANAKVIQTEDTIAQAVINLR